MSDDPDSTWNRAAATWWGVGGLVVGLLVAGPWSCDVDGSRVIFPATLGAPATAACTNLFGTATWFPGQLASLGAALLGVGVFMLIGYGVDAVRHRRAA